MSDASKTDLVDKLKKLMIRHTKGQRIGGGQALSLPTLKSETEWLVFTPSERGLYDAARRNSLGSAHMYSAKHNGMAVWPLMMQLHQMTMACSNVATKLKALEKDLRELQSTDPTFHAVIFTQFKQTHESVVRLVGKLGIETCAIAGGVSMGNRHKAIRNFQESSEQLQNGTAAAAGVRPKVMVATIKVRTREGERERKRESERGELCSELIHCINSYYFSPFPPCASHHVSIVNRWVTVALR